MTPNAAQPKIRIRKALRPLQDLIQHSAAGGIVLIAATTLALLLANSPLAASYQTLLHSEIGPTLGPLHLHFAVLEWINDGLMTIFFLLVGLEIKREVLTGELSNRRAALLPILAATGGAVVPAFIYALLNHGSVTASGWGIPMATDIAFTLGVLALLGRRIPPGLKIFVSAAAIVDDLIAIVVIALFYSSGLNALALGAALGLVVLMLAGSRAGIQHLGFYLALGVILWYALLQSGIHASIAGVLIALTIPAQARTSGTAAAENAPAPHARASAPLVRLEHTLQPWVAFGIMPVFALANAAIPLTLDRFSAETGVLALGVVLGLVIGKPIGILFSCILAVRSGAARLPHGVRWQHLVGAACLGGIGFTMSLFIAALGLHDASLLEVAKLSILAASLIAGAIGFVLLRRLPVRD